MPPCAWPKRQPSLRLPTRVLSSYWRASGALTATLIFLFFAYILTKRIIAPLDYLSKVIGEIASGKLDTSIMQINRKDEIGDIALAVKDLQEKSREMAAIREQQFALQSEIEADRGRVVTSIASNLQENDWRSGQRDQTCGG